MDEGTNGRRYSVGPKLAAASILLFWSAYYLSVSARSVLMEYPNYEQAFDNRALVTLAGMGFTWLFYLALRRLDRRKLGVQVAAAFLLSVPVAAAYAATNYYSFYVYDPDPKAMQAGTAVSGPDRKEKEPLHLMAEGAIHWYFFVACWAALYLALSYAAQVRGAEREAARYRAAAQSAELRALRYQVNPHFLFNTLNSISSLVMARRNEQAEAMILNLSSFFRTSLAPDLTGDVRLQDEIALQRLYLELESVRFPDRLDVQIDVEPGLADACVPGMILQPLVENALKHGVSPARRPVTLSISAARENGRLRIEVSDNGDAAAPTIKGTGVGLRNVHDRLEVRFDGSAELVSSQRPEGGFGVTLRMPLVFNGC